jgi:hypothetical protein
MQTPAGTECPYYFADFHRGRSKQSCRLIEHTPNGGVWSPDLCSRCEVPRILQANACPNMTLEARVKSALFGLIKRVKVTAYCNLIHSPVAEPQIGCGHCHETLNFDAFPVTGETEPHEKP